MALLGAERAKLSRIRAKPADKRTPEDFAWHAELEARHKESLPLDNWQESPPLTAAQERAMDAAFVAERTMPPPSTPPNADKSTGPAAGSDDVWDRVIDATADDDDDDDGDSGEHEVKKPGNGASEPRAEGAGPAVPDKAAPMSLDVARGTAGSFFLLNSSAWSMLGDRDPRYLEPSDEERRLLSGVFASYAERYGWTKELDDAILLGTVLLVYNARCFKAPRKPPAKKIGPGETK